MFTPKRDGVIPTIRRLAPRVLLLSCVLILAASTTTATFAQGRTMPGLVVSPNPTVSPTPRAPSTPSPTPTPRAAQVASLSPSPTPQPARSIAPSPSPAPSTIPSTQTPSSSGPASASDPRLFPQTGFRIDQDAFWNYFNRRGGVDTFGYPISETFTLLGTRVQMFQRLVVQLQADGSVGTLNLLDDGLLPYTHVNGSTFPPVDPAFVGQTPPPSDPNYLSTVIRFVQANAPDTFDGRDVNFGQTFFHTVPISGAFPDGPPDDSTALLAGFNLEIWGLPTSRPTYDPTNKNFIYQRFQRGIMHYDAGCNCTHGLLLADYLKALLLNQNVPGDLSAQAGSSPLLAQWAPGKPMWLARPAELNGTDLTNAFVAAGASAPPTAAQPVRGLSNASVAVLPATPSAPLPSIPLLDGYDVSFPQCSKALPSAFAFTIVGVNNGRAFNFNPCLGRLMTWAQGATPLSSQQPRLSFYLNIDNPGPEDAYQRWPAAGLSQPRPCDGSASLDCAYDYGWYAAQAALTTVGAPGASAPWWLDVEVANTWSPDVSSNVAVLQGALAMLKAASISSVGVYSSPRQWGQITGATGPDSPVNQPFANLPNWLARAHSTDEAPTLCSRTFTGGRVKLVQYPANGFDADYACF